MVGFLGYIDADKVGVIVASLTPYVPAKSLFVGFLAHWDIRTIRTKKTLRPTKTIRTILTIKTIKPKQS